MTNTKAPRNRHSQAAARANGDIRGFMKLPRGRPTKVAPTPSSRKVSAGASNQKRKAVEPATQRKKRGPYKRWIDGANKVFLDAAVVAKLKEYDPDKGSADDLTVLMQISGSTLCRSVKQEKKEPQMPRLASPHT